MTPISTEQSKTIDFQERQLTGHKERLISQLDDIAKKYDPQLINKDLSVVRNLTSEIVDYFKETEKPVDEGTVYPIRVLQPIRHSDGQIHGLGFGIEIAAKEEYENPSLRFQMLSRFAKKLDNFEHGNYSTSTPTVYHYSENGYYSRGSVICTAQVLTSDLFRNMGINDNMKIEIMEGILEEIAERE
jgi:hypothetical protein